MLIHCLNQWRYGSRGARLVYNVPHAPALAPSGGGGFTPSGIVDRTRNAMVKGVDFIKHSPEKAGKVGQFFSKAYQWAAADPRSIVGAVFRLPLLPFWASRKVIESQPYKDITSYYDEKKKFLIEAVRGTIGKVFERAQDTSYVALKTGYHVAATPALEAGMIPLRMAKRALFDNAVTGLNAVWQIPTTGIKKGVHLLGTGWEWLKNVGGVRNSVGRVLNGGKALWNREWKEAAKNFVLAPFEPVLQTAKVPIAAAAIPGYMAAEAAMAGAQMVGHSVRAGLTPVEAVVNSFSGYQKGYNTLKDYVSEFAPEAKGYRDRIKDTLKGMWSPMQPHDLLEPTIA